MRLAVSLCLAILALAIPTPAPGQETDIQTESSWIWFPEDATTTGLGVPRYLRRTLSLEAPPERALLRVMSDDRHTLWLNGQPIRDTVSHGPGGIVYDLRKVLVAGENVLAFEVVNITGPGGIILKGEVLEQGGRLTELCSDASFRASTTAPDGWRKQDFDDSAWVPAAIVGNAFAAPWYHHSSFDMDAFLTDADRQRWSAWREPLLRLPEGLKDEAPTQAAIEWVNGTCALTIDGQARPAFLYRGTVDPMSLHGRRQIGLFRDAGIHAYTAYLPLASCWTGPGEYDFALLDERVRGYLSADPEARLVLILRLVPPAWWMDAYRDELVRYAMGEDFNTSDESGRVRRPSLASKRWQQDAMAVWRAAIRHLESKPWGKRVIGYQPGYGIYTEWHYFGSWHEQMPDTGPAMTAAFRRWLQKKYTTDAALRKAWRRDDVALDTVTVPEAEPRLVTRPIGSLLPGNDQWVIDYYRCQQQLTADVMESFCAAAKEETGGRTLSGAFYGYHFGVHPQTQGGHLELEGMLESPAIDYFAAPYDYSHRLVGDDGRGRAVVDAFPLAGKAHMVEVDTRTHLHSRNEYGRVANTEESIAVIRREIATTLLHGSAMWWCDFGTDGSGGWYDHPELIAEVAAMNCLANDLLNVPRTRTAQIALVCDLESFFHMADGGAMGTQHRILDDLCTKLKRLGAPVDMLFLSQLDQADLSRYRLLVFPHALCLSAEQRDTVARAVAGRTALWLWAPGITDGKQFSPDFVHDVTGISVRLDWNGVPADTVICEADHPLTRNIPSESLWDLVPRQSVPVPDASSTENWFNPRDTKTMESQYSNFDWSVDEGVLRWEFATTSSWTDLHLKAAIPQCDGVQFTAGGQVEAGQLSLSFVLKGSDGSEFVAGPYPVEPTPTTHVVPIAAFEKASWSQSDAPLSFPLRGIKVVLYGCQGNRPGQLRLSDLSAVQGDTRRQEVKKYTAVCQGVSVLAVDDGVATPLGHSVGSDTVVLACQGEAPARTVLATVPTVPLGLLRALADEAGVHRYIDREDVLVAADSALISLHTRTGGPITLRLPRSACVIDALSGELLGEGDRLEMTLDPVSTTILRTKPTRRAGEDKELPVTPTQTDTNPPDHYPSSIRS